MPATVSVIMPCYNAASYLRESISSVLNQTFRDFEFIIINDGSIDDTEQIIKSYNDERIRYYAQPNQGQCAASNYGLHKATGQYIKFFDADDVMNAQHLELQLNEINGATDVLASCEWGRFYNNDPHSAVFKPESVWKSMDSLDWIKTALSQSSDMMGAPIWLIPREVIMQSGGWDERLSLNNDFDFSIRLLLNSRKVIFCPGAKIYYRTGIPSLSVTASRKAYENAFLSTQLGCDNLLKREYTNEMKKICANRYQLWVYRIFPHYPDVVKKFELEIRKLGGTTLELEGSLYFKFLIKVIGWKTAKRIKLFLMRLGYTKLPSLFKK